MDKIVIKRTRDLDSAIAAEIASMDQAHFGSVPIVQKYRWSPTDWTLYAMEQGQVASSAKIVERVGLFDKSRVKLGGVNNVITCERWRGKGLSSAIMRVVDDFMFNELKCDAGLLFCATELIPFYERFRWKAVTSAVYFDQPSEKTRWEAETMLLRKNPAEDPNEIDLMGLPW